MSTLLDRQLTKRRRRLALCAASMAFLVVAVALAFERATVAHAGAAGLASAGTLTIIQSSPPATLDPGRANNGGGGFQYDEPAYDPLIYLAPNGHYEPDLATSWSYVGKGNKKFVIHLRPNVQFSDGTTLNATDVVNYINYAKAGTTTAASYLGNLTQAIATGPLTVTLRFSQAQPDLPTDFDQQNMAGDIVGPNLLNTAAQLGTKTDGAGPYMLDPSQTVTGSKYVYVQNPHYWNKSLRRYTEIVYTVIADPSTGLSALESGQADFMTATPTQVGAAKSGGLRVFASDGGTFEPLWITDYRGKLVKALGNLKVRQAIAYATNRRALAKALYGPYGFATDESSSPGFTGYIPSKAWNNYYRYNVAKAKRLLKQAGYPHGFAMTLPTVNANGEQQATEALASELKTIGIRVKLAPVATFGEWVTAFTSGKYPGGVLAFGTLPASVESTEIWQPKGVFNVFHNPLPKILADVARGNRLDGAAAANAYQDAMKLWIKGAYADTLFGEDDIIIARPGVASNVEMGPKYPGVQFGPDYAFLTP